MRKSATTLKSFFIFTLLLSNFNAQSQADIAVGNRVIACSKVFDSLFIENPTRAMEQFKDCIEIVGESEKEYALAETNYLHGRYYLDKSFSDSAKYHFDMAKNVFLEMDSISKPNIIDYYLASIENKRGNYYGAQTIIEAGLSKIPKSYKDSLLHLRFMNLKASVFSNLDDQKNSIEQALRALELAEKLKDKPRIALVLKTLGSSYHYASNHELALEYKQRSLEAYRELNDMPMVGTLLNNIGNGVSVMGDEEGAIPYFKESLEISEKYENNDMIAITSFCLGRSYTRLGTPEKGVPYFNRSLHISKNVTKSPKTEMWALNGLANAFNNMKQPQKAIPLLNRTIKLSDSIGRKADKAVAYDYRSASYEQLQQYKKSINDARMFKLVSDSIADIERVEEIERLTIVYETEKKEAEIALQQEEINTLNEKAKVDNLTKGLYAGGMFTFLAISGLIFFGFKQRMKKNRIAREKQEEIYKQEIEHKKKELASQTLHLVQKNTFLEELKENLQNLKNSPDKFKMEFRRIAMLLKKEKASDRDWETFKTYFSEVHNDFDQKLKTLSSDITEKEIRLAAFLRMNLTTKEIAATMNVLPDSILKSKYRLKKKLGLDKETDLNQFLNEL